MKDKVNDNKLKKILNDYVVSWQVLLLVTSVLFVSDYFLSNALYVLVLDMGELGKVLAVGMAILFTVLPKVAAKLFAKNNYPLGLIGIACGIGLLIFVYIGQSEVARQKAQDPLAMAMLGGADGSEISESNIHVVATSLIGLLYGCAVFISYLYYRDEEGHKQVNTRLAMSKLSRLFDFKLLPLKGRFERASAKPTTMAEGRVNEHLRSLQAKERELLNKLDEQEGNRNYEMAALDNARKRIKMAIETAYKN